MAMLTTWLAYKTMSSLEHFMCSPPFFLFPPLPPFILSHSHVPPPSPPSHLSADVLRLLHELIRVLLLVLAHSSVHLLPLDALLALAEG